MTEIDTDNAISLVADAKDADTVDVGRLVEAIKDSGFDVERDDHLESGHQVGWEITPK